MLLFWVHPDSLLAKTGCPKLLPLGDTEMTLEEHVKRWQEIRELLNADSREYVKRHILRKLDVLIEAAQRRGIGMDAARLLENWIDETVDLLGLKKLVENILQEREASGKPINWTNQVQVDCESNEVSLTVGMSSIRPGWMKSDDAAAKRAELRRRKRAEAPKNASPRQA